jgi:hypothetical protein
MTNEDYWGSVYSDLKTVISVLARFNPTLRRILHGLSFAELLYAIKSGHGIQPSDPNYNAPVGNSPPSI